MSSPVPLRPLTHSSIPQRPLTVCTPPVLLSEEEQRAIAIKQSVDDPKLFFESYLGVNLWSTQREILDAVNEYPRVAVKSCHASSKTFSAGRLVLWWLTKHIDATVITTGPSWHQIETQLWGEVHSALKTSKIQFPPANLTQLKIDAKRLAYGLSTSVTKQDEGVKIQGIHGKNVLVIIDEAPGLNPKIWEAIEGARSGGNVRVLALGNPTIASGPFHSAFVEQRSGWKCFTIDAFNTPNFETIPNTSGMPDDFVTEKDGRVVDGSKLWWLLRPEFEPYLGVAPHPYLIQRTWVKEMFYEWGVDHPSWQSRVRGQFPVQGEDALISLAWLEEQKNKDYAEKASDEVTAGIDVAGPGEDETTLTIRRGPKIIFHESSQLPDPRGWLMMNLMPFRDILKRINIDIIGLGYHVWTHIRDTYGERAVPINVCETASDSERYADVKAEYFWGLRMRLQKGDFYGLHDEKTIGQLAGIRWKTNARGQIEIESKEDAKKRGVKSPDRAEGVMFCFAGKMQRLYGALQVAKEIEQNMLKVHQSTMVKPQMTDQQLKCPTCEATCVVPNNGGWRCNQCGYQWTTSKKQIPGVPNRMDMLKMNRR